MMGHHRTKTGMSTTYHQASRCLHDFQLSKVGEQVLSTLHHFLGVSNVPTTQSVQQKGKLANCHSYRGLVSELHFNELWK